MSQNRVIGDGGRIPWHLPDDFKWFKRATMGQVLVMGRKTFESIGRPLPGRETLILSRQDFTAPGTSTVCDLTALAAWVDADSRETWVAGGAEIYALLLPFCTDLYLTQVKRTVSGDAFFPAFEADFEPVQTVLEHAEFTVTHYRRSPRKET